MQNELRFQRAFWRRLETLNQVVCLHVSKLFPEQYLEAEAINGQVVRGCFHESELIP